MPLMPTALAEGQKERLDERTKRIYEASSRIIGESQRINTDMKEVMEFLNDYAALSRSLAGQDSNQQVAQKAPAQQAPAAKKSNKLVADMIKVANRLDQLGLTKEADLIDQLIEDMASEESE